MKPTTRIRLSLTILAILALSACVPVGQTSLPPLQATPTVEPPPPATQAPVPQTPVPAPSAETPLATPTAEGLTLKPPAVEQCDGMAQALSEALSRASVQTKPMEVTQSDVAMTDYANGASGTGCRALATGTGEQFPGPDAVMKAITAVLTGGGWVEDTQLAAGGPNGIGSGFRSGSIVSLAFAGWKADASANCPQDKPVSECKTTPAQQLYTIYLDTADESAGTPSQSTGLANPASQNCVAQGGMLKIEARGDGGQSGVCYFEDNLQCEEWALMRGECPVGGVKVTGYNTSAARYCAITGGTYVITGKSGQADEQGTCTLPGGKACDAWDYYNGKCDAASGA